MEEIKLDYTELEQTVRNLLPENFPLSFEELVEKLISGELDSWKEIFSELWNWLMKSVTFPMEHGARLFFLIIFSALFSNLSKAFSKEGTSHIGFLCVYLLMAVHAATGFASSLTTTTEGMNDLLGFAAVLLPLYCISIAAVTGSVTAAGYYQGTVFLLGFLESFVRFCLLPMTQIYIMLAFASCMQKKPIFEKLLELIENMFSWIKKTLLSIALALGAVQGILCPAIDNLKRTVVVQSASVIPGIGNLFSGAWETVLGAGAVLKNAVGLAGVVFLFLIMSIPLIKLTMHYLVYRILGAVTQPVTQEMTEQFLQYVGTAQKLLLQTLTLGVLLLLLLLVVMTRIS